MFPKSTKRSSSFSIDSLLDKKPPKAFVSKRPPCSGPSDSPAKKFSTGTIFASAKEIHETKSKLAESLPRQALTKTEEAKHAVDASPPIVSAPRAIQFDQKVSLLGSERQTSRQTSMPRSPSVSPTFPTTGNLHTTAFVPPNSRESKFDSFTHRRSNHFLVASKIISEFPDHRPERSVAPRLPNPSRHLPSNFPPNYFNPHHVPTFHHVGGLVNPFVPQGPCRPDVSYFTWLFSRHGSFLNNRIPSTGTESSFIFPFRKPKRIRTAFSPSQLLQLEEAFGKNHYVVGQERKDLAASLNLTETQVKVWFQNRRTKHKRIQPGEEEGSNEHADDVMTSDDDDDDEDNDDEEEYVDVDSPLSFSPINGTDSNHVTNANSRSTNENEKQS